MRPLCPILRILVIGFMLSKGSTPLAYAADYNITISGGDCFALGEWDASTKTCTLKQGVLGSILLGGDVTLDGGGFEVVRQDMSSGSNGIEIRTGQNVTIRNIKVSGWDKGIQLIRGHNSVIASTTVHHNTTGIEIFDTSFVRLENNHAYDNRVGIMLLAGDSGMILRGNRLERNDINFFLNTTSHYGHDIDTTNTANGAPIRYFENLTDVTFENIGESGPVYCIRCEGVALDGIVMQGTNGPASTGMMFWESRNVTVRNSHFEGI